MGKPAVAIVGPGAVGQAIGRLLVRRGYPVAVAGRTPNSARRAARFIGGRARAAVRPDTAARNAQVVFITTPDAAIAPVCDDLVARGAIRPGMTVFHCCGAYGAELLESAGEAGAAVASLHPAQSFASPEQAVQRLAGSWFTLAGDADAEPVAKEIVAALGGDLVVTPIEDRALYHAALCVLSNYQVAVVDLGCALLEAAGLTREEAERVAQPLARGTAENIESVGPVQALTGPIERGDVKTVARHLDRLAALPESFAQLYRRLGLYTVEVALRKGGLAPATARKLRKLLSKR